MDDFVDEVAGVAVEALAYARIRFSGLGIHAFLRQGLGCRAHMAVRVVHDHRKTGSRTRRAA